ncbi:hypothetical protein WJX81_003273 [Elliptochloris bilobata]|uniref:Uncharacterized protein n=1 Tax=Elliptochloris bilobata TaxID=381761 RepID=A0AAW1QCL0_9CHLO
MPKVALLFLTTGALFHERSWALWFSQAADLLPLHSLLLDAIVGTGAAAPGAVQPGRAAGGEGFSVESIFHGTEIAERIEVGWGSHDLVVAARHLLAAAMADPDNQRFVLLSESGVPLYPPAAVHAQLLSEERSRVNACGTGYTSPQRYSPHMGPELLPHWRKSSQWFALSRAHAEHVLADQDVLATFSAFCRNAWDADAQRWRDCYSDEHYIPSLLSYLQLGHETDCMGNLVSVNWMHGGAHPRAYESEEISMELFEMLRRPDSHCEPQALLAATERMYVAWHSLEQPLDSLHQPAFCASAPFFPQFNASSLGGYACPLFARKFLSDSAAAVLRQAPYLWLRRK